MTLHKSTIRKSLAATVIVTSVTIQFIRPAKTNPPVEPGRTLHAHARPTAEVAAILDRACRDCHSNETRWPWYSNVAPVSWFVINHVTHGRRHLNLSDWPAGDPQKAGDDLDEMCDMVAKGTMPLRSYLLIHRDARLSSRDVATICGWTKGRREQLAANPILSRPSDGR